MYGMIEPSDRGSSLWRCCIDVMMRNDGDGVRVAVITPGDDEERKTCYHAGRRKDSRIAWVDVPQCVGLEDDQASRRVGGNEFADGCIR